MYSRGEIDRPEAQRDRWMDVRTHGEFLTYEKKSRDGPKRTKNWKEEIFLPLLVGIDRIKEYTSFMANELKSIL